MGERILSLESIFPVAKSNNNKSIVSRKAVNKSLSNEKCTLNTSKSPALSNSGYDFILNARRKSRSETHLNLHSGDISDVDNESICKPYEVEEKTEDILAKALKIALEKQKAYKKTDTEQDIEDSNDYSIEEGLPGNSMMMPTRPPGVQTDPDGLILPKKIVNPCLESSDRKKLHKELMFNNKIGKSVLNQKSELQRVLEKKRERQIFLQHQEQEAARSEPGLKEELNRVIMERAQKLEKKNILDSQDEEIKSYVNPEYLNAKAKLRGRVETK